MWNIGWQIDGGSGHVLCSSNRAEHRNTQRSAGGRPVEDGMAFLVWADIRADQMHIETAFRSHCNCDGFIGFSFLFFTILFLSPASWDPILPHIQYGPRLPPSDPISSCLPTTFLTLNLTCHDGGVAWIRVASLITLG